MTNDVNKCLVTCALPYANGSIHIGHLLEYILADIWVRYKRMLGQKVYFICADDTHGTPIMLKAKQLGISVEKMISNVHKEHKNDFHSFGISFDNYYTTHSKENRELLIKIYDRIKKKGLIKYHDIYQFYDVKKKIFLTDRLVRGNCPKCKSPDQYGDNCEICGYTYNSIELINPKSVLSKISPKICKSKHIFFDLPIFNNKLKEWMKSDILPSEVNNKLQEWFTSGLKEWDISRDAPYFGFKIPEEKNKYFYVWVDAPIGYMSSFKNLCNKSNNIDFNEFWNKNSTYELYHFIGKDIIYFHSLFWPAILMASDLRTPTKIFVHGHVTMNGIKMSKSRGTYLEAKKYLQHLDADYLRYYYATKLSSSLNDIDFNFKDFIFKVNSDLINKIVNLASRNANFIMKFFNYKLSEVIDDHFLYLKFVNESCFIKHMLNNCNLSIAMRKIGELADLANFYINKKSPWKIALQQGYSQEVKNICSMGINLFRILIIYLKPITPFLAKRTEQFLNTKLTWKSINQPLTNHKINSFKMLMKRIEISERKMFE